MADNKSTQRSTKTEQIAGQLERIVDRMTPTGANIAICIFAVFTGIAIAEIAHGFYFLALTVYQWVGV